jgi:hypothetical protein
LQAVVYSIKEHDFLGALKHWENVGIVVYDPKETVLKDMTAKMKQFRATFLLWPIAGTIQWHLTGIQVFAVHKTHWEHCWMCLFQYTNTLTLCDR